MKKLEIESKGYADGAGCYPIGEYITNSLLSICSRGAVEEVRDETGKTRDAFGRLIQALAQNDLLLPEQVYQIAKGYIPDETKVTFVAEN